VSHWAQIDKNNLVLQIIVGNNELPDEGESFANSLGGRWIKTSYNSKIRGNFAGIGYSYLEKEDLFMPPKCHPEATLNTAEAIWDCPDEGHIIKPIGELNANN
jgi:hypothetical protein